MRKMILICGILVGSCLMAVPIVSAQPAAAQEEEKPKLMPMDLDGTEWTVEMKTYSATDLKKSEEDVLFFKGGKFTSKLYKKDGYEPTNYSLTISEDDVTGFGTMQLKDKETSFWKGRVSGEEITGSLHIQYPKGDNETRYYEGKLTKGELKRKKAKKPDIINPDGTVTQASEIEEEPPAVADSLISEEVDVEVQEGQ